MGLGSIPIIGPLAEGLLGTGASIYNTNATIKANKELAEYQYSKDLEMWNRGNEYNAPAAQMQRIEAAGLNKNLVYGTGVTGNTATQLPKYQAPNVQYDIQPRLNLTQAISAYQDSQIKSQQVDNLKAEESARIAQTLTEAFKQAAIAQGTARSKFDYDLACELRDTSLEAQKANLRKTTAEVQNLESRTKLQGKDIELRDFDLDDRKVGIRPQDPYLLRGINRLRKDPRGAWDGVMDFYDRIFGEDENKHSVPLNYNK